MGVGRKPAGSLLFLSMHVFIHLISRVLVRVHLSRPSPRFNVENRAGNQPFTVSALLKDSTQQGVSPTNQVSPLRT